jgi:hypothetical protein
MAVETAMVARGDAALIGLVGFIPFFIGAWATLLSRSGPEPWGLVLLFLGIMVLVVAVTLSIVAEPSPWAPHPGAPTPMVSLACPIYGTPLAWVDEVSQWYCPQCQAYHGAKQA